MKSMLHLVAAGLMGEHRLFVAKEVGVAAVPSSFALALGRLFRVRPPIITRNGRPILFVHIPRTAGHYASRALLNQHKAPHHSLAYYQRISFREVEPCFKFCFVRNPWDRLVSAYHLLREGKADVVQVWDTPSKRAAAELRFDQFVLEWLLPRKDNLTDLDVVLWPQTSFFAAKPEQSNFNFIGRYEVLEEDLERLANLLSLTNRANHVPINRSIRERSDYKAYYDKKLSVAVESFYQSDTLMLGYSFG